MSLTLKSKATGNLVLVNAHAQALLGLLGKNAAEPGILEPKDMPAALAALQGLPDELPPPPEDAKPDEDKRIDPMDEPVAPRKRAWPLIEMIRRAHEAQEPIVWGV